jgi:uncharacterized protein involved in exopolysaccharide biosynthesis
LNIKEPEMSKKNSRLSDCLFLFYKRRKIILIVLVTVSIHAVGISLIMPKWFRAYTTILPPVSEEGTLGISTLLENLPLAGLGIGNVTEETDLFLAILDSRSIMEAAARKFDLTKRYKKKNMEETVKALRKHVSAEIDDEGTITLLAEARAPWLASREEQDEARKLARDMTNYFIQELDRVNRNLKSEKAGNLRKFIEKRYFQNLEDLKKAEEELKEFQQKYGIISLLEQVRATVTTAAELKAQIMAKEIEARALARYVGKSHVDFIKIQNELKEMRRTYEDLKRSDKQGVVTGNVDKHDVFLPFEDAPDLGIQYVRLYREITLQETLLEFLLPQYEEAKIKEARDTPTVQVLDEAVLPVKKHRPKRALFVLFWSFMSLLVIASVIFFKPGVQAVFKEIREKTQ